MHTIRLAAPFEVTIPPQDVTHRIKKWEAWAALKVDTAPVLLVQRHFNLPSGLMPNQPVALAVLATRYRLDVSLNNQPLGIVEPTDEPVRFPIREHLQPRNRIELRLSPSPWPPNSEPFQLQLQIE